MDENKKILDNNIGTLQRVMLLLLGGIFLGLTWFGLQTESNKLLTAYGYPEVLQKLIIDCALAAGTVLGIIFILINFNKRYIPLVAVALSTAFITSAIYDSRMRGVLIGLLVCAAIFLIIVYVLELYATVTTMFFMGIIACLFIGLVVIQIPYYYEKPSAGIFLIVTTYLILYQKFGVKLNKIFISKIMGQPERAEGFNNDLFRMNMQIIYIVIFILVNATGLLYEETSINYSNILNNCFITAFTLNLIDRKYVLNTETSLKEKIMDFVSQSREENQHKKVKS